MPRPVIGDIPIEQCERIVIFLEPERALNLRLAAATRKMSPSRFAGDFIRAAIDSGTLAKTPSPTRAKAKKNRAGHHPNAVKNASVGTDADAKIVSVTRPALAERNNAG